MKVKVCGMTEREQLSALAGLGVDYAGFIFYPPSPRFAEKKGLTGAAVKKAGLPLLKVGVFVDASYDEVMRRVDEYGLDLVQLHGRETPFECKRIDANIHVIKAFRFSGNDPVDWTIKDYYADTDFFLFDTGMPAPGSGPEGQTLFGGTGRKFDWKRLEEVATSKPFFLSGGIAPGDAGSVNAFLQTPAAEKMVAVDINSRFESAPGVKDMTLVARFLTDLKQRNGQNNPAAEI